MRVERTDKRPDTSRNMTIREFARRIGVSKTTVSDSLNMSGRVNPETRDMVFQMARKLGYTPNLNARRLAKRKSFLVSTLFPELGLYSNLYQIQMVYTLIHSLKERGYDLVIDSVQKGERWEAILEQRIRTGGIDGTVLGISSKPSDEVMQRLSSLECPCVFWMPEPMEVMPNIGCVINRNAAHELAEILLSNGHQRIGYVGMDIAVDDISQSFVDRLAKSGISIPDNYVVVAETVPETGKMALVRLMSQADPPTAIFARNDFLALSVMSAAAEMGIRVPEDVSVVGYDDLAFAVVANPPLTTVHIHSQALSDAILDTLFCLMENPESCSEPRVVEDTLIVRKSVGPAPRK